MFKKIVAAVTMVVAINGCSYGVKVSTTQMASFTPNVRKAPSFRAGMDSTIDVCR